ncbi:MAG TPA: FAD-dependent oxidoreductase [Trueperaceae bacterium]
MSSSGQPLRVAVIGAGPAGFYTAEALLKGRADVSVDIIDRLPTPFGLVRYGVAPDHQKLKSVTKMYDRTCSDPRVRFLGNVAFGSDIDREELLARYHAVVYAVGAPADRSLGIPGEELPGSMSATEFVAWYNGHPDYRQLKPPLDVERVAVIGMGNVAVDVTRILAKSVEELAGTDIADHALEHLAGSRVREVTMVGRRGPAQGKFTTKELRELGELENADIEVDPAELEVDEYSLASIEGEAGIKRNLEVLEGFAGTPEYGKPRKVRLRFCLSPVEIVGSERVEGLKLERNRLEPRDDGSIRAVPTGEYETWPVGLVLRSVGYRGTALPGVPFDERRAIIPNDAGRVLDENSRALPGEYVAGWIKRGPSGVIGTNKADAMESVASLLADPQREIDASLARPESVDRLLSARGVDVVDYERWCALDRQEVTAGESQGRPRVKVTDIDEMLARCLGAAEGAG